MKAEDIKQSDSIYLKEHLAIHKEEGLTVRLKKGTPLTLSAKNFNKTTKQIESIEVHATGSFADILIQVDQVDKYIANYIEKIDNDLDGR